jgi:acyl-CoA:acyl-CoA alkyltransferase
MVSYISRTTTKMHFKSAAIASIGCVLPPRIVTSSEIESRLQPVYQRLRLPEGRLEFASGIRERRVWNPGVRLSDCSIKAGQAAIDAAGIDACEIGSLVHASVCREFLEPATACRVHHKLGLPSSAWVYDVSNACLGLLNATVQIATLIEHGVIQAGIAVGTENSLGLMESTIRQLNADQTITRQSIKSAFASLTIGSGACAMLIVNRHKFGGGAIQCAVAQANTAHCDLCVSDTDQAGGAMQPLMDTDSEQLLEMGVETGAATFELLKLESGLSVNDFGTSVSHQVGQAHQKRILERLGLPIEKDFATYPFLGNTGSVALPTALGIGIDRSAIDVTKPTALLGIGSGINSIMMAIEAQGIKASCIDPSK